MILFVFTSTFSLVVTTLSLAVADALYGRITDRHRFINPIIVPNFHPATFFILTVVSCSRSPRYRKQDAPTHSNPEKTQTSSPRISRHLICHLQISQQKQRLRRALPAGSSGSNEDVSSVFQTAPCHQPRPPNFLSAPSPCPASQIRFSHPALGPRQLEHPRTTKAHRSIRQKIS